MVLVPPAHVSMCPGPAACLCQFTPSSFPCAPCPLLFTIRGPSGPDGGHSPYLVGGLIGGLIGGKIFEKIPVVWLKRAFALLIPLRGLVGAARMMGWLIALLAGTITGILRLALAEGPCCSSILPPSPP